MIKNTRGRESWQRCVYCWPFWRIGYVDYCSWLKENYDCDVICVAGDVGQGEELEPLHEKAKKCGAEKLYIEDLRKEFVEDFIWPTLRLARCMNRSTCWAPALPVP